MKMDWFGISDTKLFHFHMVFKNGVGGGGGREGIKRPPLSGSVTGLAIPTFSTLANV